MRLLPGRRLVLCLLAGGIITALVACAGSLAAASGRWRGGLRVYQRLPISHQRAPFLVALQEHALWERWTYEYIGLSRAIDYDAEAELPEPPAWVFRRPPSDGDGTNVIMVWTTASGWPFRSCVHVEWLGYSYPPGVVIDRKGLEIFVQRVEAGWPLSTVTPGSDERTLVIPGRPIWAGLIANILFWAASLWLLTVAILELRSNSRRRRRLCSNCGYPRPSGSPASTPCSECGQREPV